MDPTAELTRNNMTLDDIKLFNEGCIQQDNHEYSKAIRCCERCADQNDSNILFNLGICNYRITGNNVKAVKQFKKSATLGNHKAQVLLALWYYNGVAGDKDYAKAEKWCLKFLSHNSKICAYELLKNIYVGRPIEEQIILRLICAPYSELASKWLIKHAVKVSDYTTGVKYTVNDSLDKILLKPLCHIVMSYLWIIET